MWTFSYLNVISCIYRFVMWLNQSLTLTCYWWLLTTPQCRDFIPVLTCLFNHFYHDAMWVKTGLQNLLHHHFPEVSYAAASPHCLSIIWRPLLANASIALLQNKGSLAQTFKNTILYLTYTVLHVNSFTIVKVMVHVKLQESKKIIWKTVLYKRI